MTNEELAQAYVAQAEEILHEAEHLAQRGVWNLVVRRSQEAVELALKGALRWASVEVPHLHDVGFVLQRHHDRFPPAFRQDVSRMVAISRRLGRERQVSFYGDEEVGAPPQRLYVQADAEAALQDARFVLERCRALLATRKPPSDQE